MRVHDNTAGKEVKPLDKRKAIVQASVELIAEHGYHDAPMAMIVDSAGVGTLDLLLSMSKDELIQSCSLS
jgi:AcrR family transcriptional regulator